MYDPIAKTKIINKFLIIKIWWGDMFKNSFKVVNLAQKLYKIS